MNVGKEKVVTVTYTLKEENENGKILEEVRKDRPLVFLHGKGNLLPKFESQLDGKEAGGGFSFKLGADDAYGPYDQQALIQLSKEAFQVNGEIDTKLM